MTGISNLAELLTSMSPKLMDEEFVFCHGAGECCDYAHLQVRGFFYEEEGLTLILPASEADRANLPYEARFKQITLTVHSSLEAVGLTAAVSSKLAEHGISANVVAAYYHDHIYVQSEKAEAAMKALAEFR